MRSSKTQLCTKYEGSSPTRFGDKLTVKGMPIFLGDTWPWPRLFDIYYSTHDLVERSKEKLRTEFEDSSLTVFGDIVEGMSNILGVTWPRPRPFEKYYTPVLCVGPRRSSVPNLKLIWLSSTELWRFTTRTLRYVDTLTCDLWPWTVIRNFLSRSLTIHQLWASYAAVCTRIISLQ